MLVNNRFIRSKPGCDPINPTDAVRTAVNAIMKKDTAMLYEAMASTSMPIELALSVGIQAWLVDISNNKVGMRMCAGSLLCAVFMGSTNSQERLGTLDQGDNAVFLIAMLAAKHDDPRILDCLFLWEPGFRLGTRTSHGSAETTATFFMDMQAPKCSNRILERKDEIVFARRNRLKTEHAEAQALRNAQRIKEKGLCTCEIGNLFIDDIIEDEGHVQVHCLDIQGSLTIASMGLSLLGMPEVIARCTSIDEEVVTQRVAAMAAVLTRGGDIVSAKPVSIGRKHVLRGLLNATKHIRSSDVPDAFMLL